MATNQGWKIFSATPETLFTSAADLPTGCTQISGICDNTPADSSPSYIWADFVLNLPNGIGGTITIQQPVELYIIPEVDGSNFLDSDVNATDVLVPQNLYKGAFQVRAEGTATTAQRLGLMDVLIPPYNYKVYIRNNTGQSLKDGASHFTISQVRKTFSYG